MNYFNAIHTVINSILTTNNLFNNLSQIVTSPLISYINVYHFRLLYQLYSKRINFAGIIAMLALLILFLGFLINGDVNLISVLLFFVGAILVIIELFVIGAIIGIIGISLIILSIIMLGDNILLMLLNVVIASILAIIEWVILLKWFKRKIPF